MSRHRPSGVSPVGVADVASMRVAWRRSFASGSWSSRPRWFRIGAGSSSPPPAAGRAAGRTRRDGPSVAAGWRRPAAPGARPERPPAEDQTAAPTDAAASWNGRYSCDEPIRVRQVIDREEDQPRPVRRDRLGQRAQRQVRAQVATRPSPARGGPARRARPRACTGPPPRRPERQRGRRADRPRTPAGDQLAQGRLDDPAWPDAPDRRRAPRPSSRGRSVPSPAGSGRRPGRGAIIPGRMDLGSGAGPRPPAPAHQGRHERLARPLVVTDRRRRRPASGVPPAVRAKRVAPGESDRLRQRITTDASRRSAWPAVPESTQRLIVLTLTPGASATCRVFRSRSRIGHERFPAVNDLDDFILRLQRTRREDSVEEFLRNTCRSLQATRRPRSVTSRALNDCRRDGRDVPNLDETAGG